MTTDEIRIVRQALALHRSMAECGEKPSSESQSSFYAALAILDREAKVKAEGTNA